MNEMIMLAQALVLVTVILAYTMDGNSILISKSENWVEFAVKIITLITLVSCAIPFVMIAIDLVF